LNVISLPLYLLVVGRHFFVSIRITSASEEGEALVTPKVPPNLNYSMIISSSLVTSGQVPSWCKLVGLFWFDQNSSDTTLRNTDFPFLAANPVSLCLL